MKTLSSALLALALSAVPAMAQDHPLLGRFDGATQVGFLESTYDETNIIVGPIEEKGSRQQRGAGWQTVEGKIFHLYYRLPDGRTSLEALRNYEQSLAARGFDVAFTCATEAGTCFTSGERLPGLFLGLALDGTVDLPRLDAGGYVRNFFLNGNGRYLFAKLNRPEGAVHVSLAFSDDANQGRMVFARVIETGEMETNKITVVEASQIEKDLTDTGHINIYGILFDFDKADIRAESEPQMRAIADLLTGRSDLRLAVVGHTDDQGRSDYNLDLSLRRAQAVVRELTGRYGIAPARLTAEGRGFEQPVASNADEAGRSLNRRVELVRR